MELNGELKRTYRGIFGVLGSRQRARITRGTDYLCIDPVFFFIMASADLAFLFAKEKVDADISDKLVAAGVVTMKQFAVLVDTNEELRDLCKKSFGLDTADLQGKVKVSKLICAWGAAKARATEQDKTEAEAQVRNLAKQVPTNDFNAMRKGFKDRHWKLDDAKCPSQTYVEQQLEKVEKQDWRAEKLTEVVAFKEDNREGMMPVWDITGVFKSMKSKSTVPMPTDTEELRHRLGVMAASWVFVSLNQPQNSFARGVDPDVFTHYADYLLGERVWKLTSRGPEGGDVSGVSWALLLSYEYEVRSHAAGLMAEEGIPFVKALKQAYGDATVKDLYFLTPLKLASVKRAAPPSGPSGTPEPGQPSKKQRRLQRMQAAQTAATWTPPGKGKGKDKGKKGKGKGKGKASPPAGCATRTPGNKLVCWDFNKQAGCPVPNCKFEHVCGVCFAPGKPMFSCSH